MLEFLFEVLGEFLLQIVLELFADAGSRVVKSPFDDESPPWLVAIGYTLLGAVLGGVSLWLVPHHLVTTKGLRLLNLLLTPLLAGGAMALLGRWRAHRGRVVSDLDRFSYGFCFALALGTVRYLWAD